MSHVRDEPDLHSQPQHSIDTATRTPTVSLARLRHQLLTTTATTAESTTDEHLFPSLRDRHHTMSTSVSDSYIIPEMAHSSSDIHDDDLDSLPSISSGMLSSETADSADAQRHWEESLEQVQLLLTMVLVPFVGKYMGRKFAYWSRSQQCLPSHSLRLERRESPGTKAVLQNANQAAENRLGQIHGMDARRRNTLDE